MIGWAASVGSTSARAHQHAMNVTLTQGLGGNYTNPRSEPPDHAIGRSRDGLSTKVHHLVNGPGVPILVLVSPGQANDSPVLCTCSITCKFRVAVADGRVPVPRPVRGDKGVLLTRESGATAARSCGVGLPWR